MNGVAYTGQFSDCNYDGNGAGSGTSVIVTESGTHEFIFTQMSTGLSDTVMVSAPCFTLTPEYLNATIYVSEQDTVCLDISELPGNVMSVENSCVGTGEYVIFDRMTGTLCYLCTGVEVGQEAVCFTLCDDQGFCDTTYLMVTVLERDQEPAHGAVDMDTTLTNTPVIINVLENDTIASTLTSFTILQQPLHGTAMKTDDNQIIYTPFRDYCDESTPDNFQYVICNAACCDTVYVYVWVICDKIKVYTGFSPNFDEMNDVFVIEGLQNFPNNTLQVFNRWGNLVYKKEKYNNTWDGTWDGVPVPDGTYFYILDDGEGETYSGYVQIQR